MRACRSAGAPMSMRSEAHFEKKLLRSASAEERKKSSRFRRFAFFLSKAYGSLHSCLAPSRAATPAPPQARIETVSRSRNWRERLARETREKREREEDEKCRGQLFDNPSLPF